MNFDKTVTLSPDVLTQMVGEELVILDLSGEAYFGLDPVGAQIWQLIEKGTSLSDIVTRLLGEYDVSEPELRTDIEKLVGDLIEHKLAIWGP